MDLFKKDHVAVVFVCLPSFLFTVVDGTSKEVSEKKDPWSSWALVIFLGIVMTLLIIGIAIGTLAKVGSNASATQQRRQRAAAAAAAAAANRHSAQIASKMNGEVNGGANGEMLMYKGNPDTLINQAFQSPNGNGNEIEHIMSRSAQPVQQHQLQQHTAHDKSPDVIPHFNGGGNKSNIFSRNGY
jgi:hypothetical protein